MFVTLAEAWDQVLKRVDDPRELELVEEILARHSRSEPSLVDTFMALAPEISRLDLLTGGDGTAGTVPHDDDEWS